MDELTLPVTKIQKFCTHDGPGLRTTVFLKGCPLRCAWCHNPETQSADPQFFYSEKLCIGCGACGAVCPNGVHVFESGVHRLERERCAGCLRCVQACPAGALEACGTRMTLSEILGAVLQDRDFYGEKGGLTLSGGEPMAHPEGACRLLEAARAEGLSTAVETCGYFGSEWVGRLAAGADLLLWDFKDGDPVRHRLNTGVSNELILENLRRADALGARTRLRCIMVKGVNMDETNCRALAACFAGLAHCEGAELLPYHVYGSSKHAQLGLGENGRPDWIPSPADLAGIKRRLRRLGVRVL